MTDIDKVLADHRESTMPAWKGACAADGDDFPCLEYRMASELEAARRVVDWIVFHDPDHGDRHCFICKTTGDADPREPMPHEEWCPVAEYSREMEEQR